MKMHSPRSEPTLTSEGKERMSVTIRLRSSRAPLSSRRMRTMRRMRSTRSRKGGIGRTPASSAGANWSSSEMHTRKKSKRHLPRYSRGAGEMQPRCRGGAREEAAEAAPSVGAVADRPEREDLDGGLGVVQVHEAAHGALPRRVRERVVLDPPVVARHHGHVGDDRRRDEAVPAGRGDCVEEPAARPPARAVEAADRLLPHRVLHRVHPLLLLLGHRGAAAVLLLLDPVEPAARTTQSLESNRALHTEH